MKFKIVPMLVVVASLAACRVTAPDKPVVVDPSGGGESPIKSAVWKDGRLNVDVPVQVVSFGLPVSTVDALRLRLPRVLVDQYVLSFNQIVPVDPNSPLDTDDGYFANPTLPTAVYQFVSAPEALEQAFAAELAKARVSPGLYDANRMEDWLAENLAGHGIAINPNAPVMVLLHLQAFDVAAHHWKVQGNSGYLKQGRMFGERQSLLVFDVSADVDPYAGAGGFGSPVAADNVEELANVVKGATDWRLLQGPVYPVATAPCHAVTGILAVSATAVANFTDLLPSVHERFSPERMQTAFDHLTDGTPVYFDWKILTLPMDDPVLDALSRTSGNALEAERAYLSLMWEQYHVDHPGCEEYITVLYTGDLARATNSDFSGIATYDNHPGKRLAFGWANDLQGLQYSRESGLCDLDPRCTRIDDDGESPATEQIWNYLFSHETGHLLGQRHPHDISEEFDDRRDFAFSSIWSSMSYQQGQKVVDFGAIDRNNWLRNRAGWALLAASNGGREGSDAWKKAIAAADRLEWTKAWEALQVP